MLARAGLSRKERVDVFFSAGGGYVANKIGRVLRLRRARIHEEEPRKPAAHRVRDRSRKLLWLETCRSSGKAYSSKPGRRVYHAEDDYGDDDFQEDDPDGGDLEEEMARGEISGRDQSDRDWDPQDAWYGDDWQDGGSDQQYDDWQDRNMTTMR